MWTSQNPDSMCLQLSLVARKESTRLHFQVYFAPLNKFYEIRSGTSQLSENDFCQSHQEKLVRYIVTLCYFEGIMKEFTCPSTNQIYRNMEGLNQFLFPVKISKELIFLYQ